MSLAHLHYRVQIIVNRPCDSYNLNSSPLCNLTDRRSPLYWAGDAAALYSQQTEAVPDYVALLDGPSRRLYPGDRFKQEVLLPNTTDNKEIEYNAVEKDVAVLNIFFGMDTVPGENSQNSKCILTGFKRTRQRTRRTRE